MAAPFELLAAIPTLAAPLDAIDKIALSSVPSRLAYAFLLVFARIGTAFHLLPGVGELWVPPQLRLTIALAITLTILPSVLDTLPPPPASALVAAAQFAHEVVMGAFIGLAVRVTTSAVFVTGAVIGLQSGLANALQPGVVTPDATTILGVFLGLVLIAFIVNTGLDHQILAALVRSYIVVPPPAPMPTAPPLGTLLDILVRAVGQAFAIGFWIAFPIVVAGLAVNLGLGLANRFMPQLQAYFVSVPIAIMLGFWLLGLILPDALRAIADLLQATLLKIGAG